MAKKKAEEPIAVQVDTVEMVEVPKTQNVSPLLIDLSREDLNQVVAKLNEVIQFLNK